VKICNIQENSFDNVCSMSKVIKVNVGHSMKSQNNINPNKNSEELKKILGKLMKSGKSMSVGDLKLKLKTKHNISDLDIDKIIKMCESGRCE